VYETQIPISHEGNAGLFEAINISIASTFAGLPVHLHAEGLRGTGKTTILRSGKHSLPRIKRILNCPYNCDPREPHCPVHRNLARDEIERLGIEMIPMPFTEIGHSAKLGTVVGSLDLEKLTDTSRPEAAFLPGSIPRSHRGIVFVDEINRLADTAPEITDVLLGVMGTRPGWIRLEESGLPQFDLPVKVSIWAASNPDEDPGPLGDIRRQLADRFDLLVNVTRPSSVEDVLRILDKHHCGNNSSNQIASRDSLSLDTCKLEEIIVPNKIQRAVAQLYVDFGLESLRGVEAILHSARIRAALQGQEEVSVPDLLAVTPLTLRNRVDIQVVSKVMDFLSGLNEPAVYPAGQPGRFGQFTRPNAKAVRAASLNETARSCRAKLGGKEGSKLTASNMGKSSSETKLPSSPDGKPSLKNSEVKSETGGSVYPNASGTQQESKAPGEHRTASPDHSCCPSLLPFFCFLQSILSWVNNLNPIRASGQGGPSPHKKENACNHKY
jgi:magnesium chelatase subunit I